MARFYRGKAKKKLHEKSKHMQKPVIPKHPKMVIGCAVCGKECRQSPQFIRRNTAANIPIVCSGTCAQNWKNQHRSSTTDETTK